MGKHRNKNSVSQAHKFTSYGKSENAENTKEVSKLGVSNCIGSMAETRAQKRMSKDSRKASNATQANALMRKKLNDKKEREQILLWRRPIQTIHYFIREIFCLLSEYIHVLWNHKLSVVVTFSAISALYVASLISGPHQPVLTKCWKEFLWAAWWIWLGILSSVGLGSGLHTFVLYLGPHIASVTMAAYSCGSVDFPSPPYPDEIICSDNMDLTIPVTMWTIMAKVRWEAFYWGAGTALGELPPYFMARGSRLSGIDLDDAEMEEFEELQKLKQDSGKKSFLDKLKLSVERLIEKMGFLGILACASVPNPLFDVAGVLCGHFLVPFWTFFGATLIGKAIIKMHIQQIFVIVAFSGSLLDQCVLLLAKIPFLHTFQKPLSDFLEDERMKYKTGEGSTNESVSMLAWIFEKFVTFMIICFAVSLVNSFAQNYFKRLQKQKNKKMSRD